MRRSATRNEKRQASARQDGKRADPIEAAKTLLSADELRLAGKLDKARRACAGLLNQHPAYPAAHHTMGLILADMQNHQQALVHLNQSLMHDPDNWKTLTALSGVYLKLGANVMAARTLEQASALNPGDAGILVTLGEILRDDREYEKACGAFRKAAAIEPDLAPARVGLGLCLIELGKLEEAAQVYARLVAEGDTSITTLNALSELPAGMVDIDLLALIDAASPSKGMSETFFDTAQAFTRAAALERLGKYGEAWQALLDANAPLAEDAAGRWHSRREERATIVSGAAASNVRLAGGAIDEDRPVSLFILGVSRSGKTTAERLVGAHDAVKCGFENTIVGQTVARACSDAGLLPKKRAIELPPPLDAPWRSSYLAAVEERAQGARVFTNTNPGLIEDALRIGSVIPNARFIVMTRDREDTALRIFAKKYRSGNDYAYALATIREQIAWYEEMADVLAKKGPETVRVVRYEDIVSDPQSVMRIACELCGLPDHQGPLPPTGDDRGCSAPYAQWMRTA